MAVNQSSKSLLDQIRLPSAKSSNNGRYQRQDSKRDLFKQKLL
jgi:hypothetical protein